MDLQVLKKEFVAFTLAFMTLTPIGTIFHELGHITTAKFLGYKTILHYGSMEWHNDFKSNFLQQYYDNEFEIKHNPSFEGKNSYLDDLELFNRHDLLISLGGILQTTLFGSIGFLALIICFKAKESHSGTIFWMFVFLSFFWSREVFNLFIGILSGLLQQKNFFAGDEAHLSSLLDVYNGTFPIILGGMGIIILSTVSFYFVPRKLRLTFILSGILGSVLGFILWFKILGPVILP